MQPFSLNIDGRLVRFSRPVVMGIVNLTDDSFFQASRMTASTQLESRVRSMVADGVDIIDLGACSTRPGSVAVSAVKELKRIEAAVPIVRAIAPDAIISIDTFRAEVARVAVEHLGCNMINDVYGGRMDPDMFTTIARLGVPYVLTHSRGTAESMTSLTDYTNVTAQVLRELGASLRALHHLGVADVIVDPGIGFAKTVEQNYELISNLHIFQALHCPVLVGVSRKSLITMPLGLTPDTALNATTALHMECLNRGVSILRVHDVLAARQCIDIYQLVNQTYLNA